MDSSRRGISGYSGVVPPRCDRDGSPNGLQGGICDRNRKCVVLVLAAAASKSNSEHHATKEERLEQWFDRRDVLGIV